MTRTVMPDLFSAWGAMVDTATGPHVALRWMLAAAAGLPRTAFLVWQFTGSVHTRQIDSTTNSIAGGWRRIVTWGDRPAAAVQVEFEVTSSSALVRAHSGPDGSGRVTDEERVATGSRRVVLFGSSIASLTIQGAAAVTALAVVDLQELVDHPGWKLIEHVGLPVDDGLDGYYSTSLQGPVGGLTAPSKAAIERVMRGTETTGWPTTTDTGLAVPPHEPPDPQSLVHDELASILVNLAAMVSSVPEPVDHAEFMRTIAVAPPTSVHGVRAPARWDAKSSTKVHPLGTMLVAAGRDPYAALALGFGTAIPTRRSQRVGSVETPASFGPALARATNRRLPLFMVTLAHKVTEKIPLLDIEVTVAADLASLVLDPALAPPPAPTSLVAGPPHPPRRQLDRPAGVDLPWLEVVDLAWDNHLPTAASQLAPSGFAIVQAIGGGQPELLLDKRPAGGHRSHVAAVSATADPARTHFTRSGVPEAFPGEPTSIQFAVTGHDWFGRWSPWQSVGHTRVVVAPQVPALRRVDLDLDGQGAGPTGAVAVEFTWDWSDRTPEAVDIRVRLHPDATPPPIVDGSILAPGGPTIADHTISFAGADADTAPAGVLEVAEERVEQVRVYRVVVAGVHDVFAMGSRVRATVQARASERVRIGVAGQFSPPMSDVANDPVPPPAPVVPAAMQWASLPVGGIARATLAWNGTADTYSLYLADETAIARELDLPSPDLQRPPADRLADLRPLEFGAARRAFRRVTEGVTEPELAVELPRGTRLIHFYAIAPVSDTGAERPLPVGGNDYVAVATPTRKVPTPPLLTAHVADDATVTLDIVVGTNPVAVAAIEVTRVRGHLRAGTPEAAGGPLLVAPASDATVEDDTLRWRVADPGPLPPWQPLFYRAAARAVGDGPSGVVAGISSPSPAIEVVVPSAHPPTLEDFAVDAAVGGAVASLLTDAIRERTRLGSFSVTVTAVHANAGSAPTVTTLRSPCDQLPTITGPIPPDRPALYLHRVDASAASRITAHVGASPLSVVADVVDPIGRRTRASWSAP